MAATWRFDAIGTAWQIDTEAPLSSDDRAEVTAVIEAFDGEWSRFREDSTVARLAAGETVAEPTDAAAMLGAYDELNRGTAGAVNPFVGDTLAALGYGPGRRHRTGDAEGVLSWDDAFTPGSAGTLRLRQPAMIDVGAIGKGRLVDIVHDALRPRIAGGLVVDGSGDLRASRGEALRIALEHPYDVSRAIGVATVQDGALCASATNRRVWGDGLHHVLDARTGRPVDTVVATWALHAEAMWADALATALFFPGGPALAEAHGVAWVRMYSDGRADFSLDGADVELF